MLELRLEEQAVVFHIVKVHLIVKTALLLLRQSMANRHQAEQHMVKLVLQQQLMVNRDQVRQQLIASKVLISKQRDYILLHYWQEQQGSQAQRVERVQQEQQEQQGQHKQDHLFSQQVMYIPVEHTDLHKDDY